ncbi:uncharacterized protein LOC131953357 [Physella acuta]|uniref:uncharacterized protein LOC131953357 n=1 Tax=Physella acuta TaxID=109671 RepID=UPI0027DD25ED|nr:uncharacterized protein LOC131953357 [Physella acuta]
MVSVVPALCLALLLPAVSPRSSKLPGGCAYTTNIVTCDGAHNLDYKYLAATVMMDYVVVFNVDIVVVTSSPCSIAKLVDCGVALPLDEPIIVAGLIVSRKSPQLRWAVKHQIMNLCDKIEDLFDSELRIQFYNAVMQDLKAEESELEKIAVSKGEPIYLHKVEPFPPTLPTFVTTVQPVEPKRLTTGENDAVAQFFESSVVKDVAKAIEQIPTNVGPINNEGKVGDNPSEEELQIVLKEEMKDIKKDMKGRRKRHVDSSRRKWRSRRPRSLADDGFRSFSNNREQSIELYEPRSKRQVGKKKRKWQSRRPRSLSPAQESINGWSNYREKMTDLSKLNKKVYTENNKRRWRSRQRKQLTLAEEIFEILFSNSSDRGELTERMKGQLGNKRRRWRSRRHIPLTPSEEMLDKLLSNATIHERNFYLPTSYEDFIQGRKLTRYKRVASLPIFIPQKVFINGEYLSMFDTNGIAEDKRLEATLVTPGTIPPIRTTPPPTTTPSVGDHRNPAAAMLFKNAEEARAHAVSNGLLNLDDEDDDDDDVENESPVLTDPIDQVSEQALLKQIQVNKGPMKAPNNTAVVVDRWSEMRRAQAEATAADHRVKSFVIFFVAVIGVISVVAVLLILAMKDKRSWGKFAIFELPKKRSERERREHQEKLLRQHEQMIQRKRNIYNHYDGVDSDETSHENF